MLVHFKNLPLHFGTHSKREFTAYWLVLKATRVFLNPTQVEKTEDGEHFVND